MILELLRGIEGDTGWAANYRIPQLLKEWDWERDAGPAKG